MRGLVQGLLLPFGDLARLEPRWAGRLLAAALAFGYVCGGLGLLHFLLLPAGLTGRWWTVPVLGIVLAGAVAGFRRKTLPAQAAAAGAPPLRWVRPLAMIIGAMGVLILGAQIIAARAAPYGQWDAFSIWNLRARFFAGPGESWKHAVNTIVVEMHPEYPPLLSSAVAAFWKLTGTAGEAAVPLILSLAFFWAAAALLVASVAVLRGTAVAVLGALALATAAPLLEQSTWQYADIPLAYYFLATLGLLALAAAEAEAEKALLPLSGLFAGFAACTKNEGIPFLAVVPALWALLVWRKQGGGALRRNLGLWGAGAAGPALLLAAFKIFIAPAIGPLGGQSFAQLADKLTNPARYQMILASSFDGLLELGRGPSHPLLILAALALALRFVPPGARRPAAACGAVVAVMLAVYWGVYLVTPNDLTWLLNTSLVRLYVQLLPGLLLAAFLALRAPAEPAAAEPEPQAPRRSRKRKPRK